MACDYMMRVIDRLQTDGLKSICIKEPAQAEFNKWIQSRMRQMVFSADCKSWCKQLIVPGFTSYVY